MALLSADEIHRAVQAALAEDIGTGDVTTLATVPENASVRAAMVAREPLVLAGFAFAEEAFRELEAAGVFSAAEAQAIRAEGRRVLQRLQASKPPFSRRSSPFASISAAETCTATTSATNSVCDPNFRDC